MFPEEAKWLQGALAELSLPAGSVVVDVGSSTDEFRRLVQPHIDFFVMRPLRQRKVRVVHVDSKRSSGVDVVHDVTSDEPLPHDLEAVGDVVLCANMFEHVADRAALARRLEEVLAPTGTLIVTVPHVYPLHEDPIDTMFRPTPVEIADLFPALRPQRSEIIAADLHDVVVGDGSTYRLARRFARVLLNRLRDRVRPPSEYQVSIVVMQRAG